MHLCIPGISRTVAPLQVLTHSQSYFYLLFPLLPPASLPMFNPPLEGFAETPPPPLPPAAGVTVPDDPPVLPAGVDDLAGGDNTDGAAELFMVDECPLLFIVYCCWWRRCFSCTALNFSRSSIHLISSPRPLRRVGRS